MEAMEEVLLTGTAAILSLTATIQPSCIYATSGVESFTLDVLRKRVRGIAASVAEAAGEQPDQPLSWRI